MHCSIVRISRSRLLISGPVSLVSLSRAPVEYYVIAREWWAYGGITMARVALVTGGTRGIGAEISRALQNAGRIVVATYTSNDVAAETFSKETESSLQIRRIQLRAMRRALKKIVAEVGPIEILVNNAGITRDGTLMKMSPRHVGCRHRHKSRLLLQPLQTDL